MTYEEYYNEFCLENEKYKDKDYSVYDYTNDDFKLIINGEKTKEASLYDSYIKYKEPLPVVGDVAVILDDDNNMCIIEDTNIELVPYSKVKNKYDLEDEAKEDDISLNDESIVVIETFKVIKK